VTIYGWEGNRRSGVALAICHMTTVLSTYGLKGLYVRELSTRLTVLTGLGALYLYRKLRFFHTGFGVKEP